MRAAPSGAPLYAPRDVGIWLPAMSPRKRASRAPEPRSVDRSSPEFDLSVVIEGMPEGDARCRDDAHLWQPHAVSLVQWTPGLTVWERTRRCPRCKTKRTQYIHPDTGEYVRKPEYDYRTPRGSDPGYRILGLGNLRGQERGALRLANIRREALATSAS